MLNLKYESIDLNKPFDYHYDKYQHVVELYLLYEIPRICHYFNEDDISSTVTHMIKHCTAKGPNVIVKLHRRKHKCNNCGQYFLQFYPLPSSNIGISIYKDYLIFEDLKVVTNNIKPISEKYFVSPTYILNLFDNKVEIKRRILPEVLC